MTPFSAPALGHAQRHAIGCALRLAHFPFLALEPYERLLLEAFERGELSLDQVLAHVEGQEYAAARRRAPGLA